MIEQPKKIRQENELTFLNFSNGWKRCFIRGGISFPEWDRSRQKFIGTVTVCGLNMNNIATLYICENFEKYDFHLAELLKKIFEIYGVGKFYYREDSNGRESARKFSVTAGMRKREKGDAVYPILIPLSFPSDYHAMESFIIRSAEGSIEADETSPVMDVMGEWTDEKGFDKAPSEIRSLICNLAGLDRDFIYYKRSDL